MCPFCKSDKTGKLFDLDKRVYGDRFSIVKCEVCGIAWTDPIPDEREISKFYPEEYHGKMGRHRFMPVMEFLVWLSRRKRAKEVSSLNSDLAGKILDIGCGRGWMISILKSMGWEVYGTELSVESSSFARESLNLNVLTKKVADCNFQSGYFDVVTLWHVLEHLPDPISGLREINRVLKDNGALVVEVPDFGGFQARLFGNKWFHLDSPRHLFHFTDKTLKRCLEDTGFKVIKRRNLSWEYDLFGFVQSILNLLCFKFDYLYNFLRSRDGRMIKGHPLRYIWDLLASIVLFPFLLAASVPVSLISSALGAGGTIKYHCIKRPDLK